MAGTPVVPAGASGEGTTAVPTTTTTTTKPAKKKKKDKKKTPAATAAGVLPSGNPGAPAAASSNQNAASTAKPRSGKANGPVPTTAATTTATTTTETFTKRAVKAKGTGAVTSELTKKKSGTASVHAMPPKAAEAEDAGDAAYTQRVKAAAARTESHMLAMLLDAQPRLIPTMPRIAPSAAASKQGGTGTTHPAPNSDATLTCAVSPSQLDLSRAPIQCVWCYIYRPSIPCPESREL